ncbi:hypothetical protein PINS_up000380 [Pythium insidiosum]|nr:hypothetical protein PINS_up000380 [Pythium insidiosum]
MQLQRELEDVQSLIRLQEEKLRLLESLRTTAMTTDAPQEQQSSPPKHSPHDDASTKSVLSTVEKRLEQALAMATHASWNARFDSHFVERAELSLAAGVVDVKMDKLRGLPTHELIAVAYRGGEIVLFVSPSEELLRIPTALSVVHSIQLDIGTEPPLLAVLGRSSTSEAVGSSAIIVYTLELRRHDRDLLRAAPAPAPTAEDTASKSSASYSSSSTSSAYALTVYELHRFVSPPPRTVSAFTLVRASRKSMLGVAHSDGRMAFLAPNGSLLHELELGTRSTPITTLTSQRNVLAFAVNASTVLFVMSRQQQPELHVCPGSLANVVSIAFDPNAPELLYSATADGEILAYTFRPNGSPACRLRHRVIVQRGVSHAIAVPQSGYVVAVGPFLTSVYNSTGSATEINRGAAMSLVCSYRSHAPTSASSLPVVASAENAYGATIALLHVVASGSGVTLKVLQSLLPLPSTPETSDASLWRGTLFVGIVAVVVLTTQCLARRPSSAPQDDQRWKDIIDKFAMDGRATAAHATTTAASKDRRSHGDADAFRQARNLPAYDGISDGLRKKIEEARRETLECAFDSDEYDLDDDQHVGKHSRGL